MSTVNHRVPIAILIFTVDSQTLYKAYSPTNWQVVSENDYPEFDIQLSQFLARLHNHIAYDPQNPSSNQTNYGNLQEIHVRHILMPVSSRGLTAYFSTYDHPHCNYRPIHRPSPVFFDPVEATNYSQVTPSLTPIMATHETV